MKIGTKLLLWIVLVFVLWGLAPKNANAQALTPYDQALVICREKYEINDRLQDFNDKLQEQSMVEYVAANYFVCIYNEEARIKGENAKFEFFNAVKTTDSNWILFNIAKNSYDANGNITALDFKLGVGRKVDHTYWDLTLVMVSDKSTSSDDTEFELTFAPNLPNDLKWIDPSNQDTRTFSFPGLPYAVGEIGYLSCGTNNCGDHTHSPLQSFDLALLPTGRSGNYYGRDTYLIGGGRVVVRKDDCLGVMDTNSNIVTMYLHVDAEFLRNNFALGDLVHPYQFTGKTIDLPGATASPLCQASGSGHHNHLHFLKLNNKMSVGSNSAWVSNKYTINPVGTVSLNGWILSDENTFTKNGTEASEGDLSETMVHTIGDCPNSGSAVYLYKGANCTGGTLELQAWIPVASVDAGLKNPVIKGNNQYFIGFPVTEKYAALSVPRGYNAVLFSSDGNKRACTYGSLANLGEFFYPQLDIIKTHLSDGNSAIYNDLGYIIVRKNSQGLCNEKEAYNPSNTNRVLYPSPIYYKSMVACLGSNGGCSAVTTITDSGNSGEGGPGIGGGPSDGGTTTCTIDPSTKGVILYSGIDFTGSCMLATASIASFAGKPVADNAVSSVRVNGKYRVRFYEDPNFVGLNGRYEEVNSSKPNLDIATLGNQISSAQIEEIVECDTTEDGVYLYKNPGYDGSCTFTNGDIADLGSTAVGNDAISSVKIVGDYELKLWEDKNFAGRSEPIFKSTENLDNQSLGNQYSSLKVWKKAECRDLSRRGVYVYSNYNYSGNCVFVAYGSPDPNFGDIVAMDHVRSFKLVGVDCIKLYEHRNYGGRADRVCSNKVQRDYNYRIWGVEPWMRPLPLPPPNTVIFNAEGGTFDIGYSNYSAVKISVAVNGNTADIKYRPDCFKPIGVFDTLVDPDLQVGVHNHLGYPNWRTEAQDEIPGNGRFDWNLGMDQLGVNNAVVGELYCNIVAWDAKQGTGENTETEMADANGYMYIHVTVNQTLAAPVYVRQCLLPANGQTFDVMPDLCWNNPTGYKLLFDLFKKSQAGTVTQILGINWTNSGREAISYNEAGVYGVRYAEMNMTTKKWFYYNGGAISWFTVKNASSGTGLARSLESIPALEQSPSYVTALYLPLVVTDASTLVEIPQGEEHLQQNVGVEEKQPTDAKPIEQSAMTVQIFLPIVAND